MLSVVIPSRNGARLLRRFLPPLLDDLGDLGEVVVVDDGSEDDTAAAVAGAGDGRVGLVRRSGPNGFCYAVNRGMEEAGGDLLLLLNNDVEPEPGALASLVDAAGTATPDVCALVPRILRPDGTDEGGCSVRLRRGLPLVDLEGRGVPYPSGACSLFTRRRAERAAQRDLRALATPLLSCTIYCGQEAADLDIGDTFKLEWPDYHEGAIIMRVTGMAFGDGRTDRIKIDCVEDVFGQPEAAILSDDRGSLWTNPTAPPDNIEEIDGNSSDQLVAATTQIAEELPYRLLVNEVGPRQIDAYMAETPDVGILATSGAEDVSSAKPAILLIWPCFWPQAPLSRWRP
ncbi:MAG: glycosyltransferase, partial [Candidatus Fermentibacteraceae bacterium]